MKMLCHDCPVQFTCDLRYYPDNHQNILKHFKSKLILQQNILESFYNLSENKYIYCITILFLLNLR